MRVMKICILQIHDSKYILNWDQYNVLDKILLHLCDRKISFQ